MAIGASAGVGGGLGAPKKHGASGGASNIDSIARALSGTPSTPIRAATMPGGLTAAQITAHGGTVPSALGGPTQQGAAPGGGGGGGGPLVNNAAADPNLSQFQTDIRNRIATSTGRETQGDPLLQEQVGNLRNRMSADPRQRAQDFAAQDIGARQRAGQAGLSEDMARRGIAGDSGAAMELRSKINETAMKESARSAAGIALGRERDLDALTLGGQGIMSAPGQYGLQREGMTNQLMGLQGDAARSLANQGVSDRSLGLQQWIAQGQDSRADQQLSQQSKSDQLNMLAQMMALQKMAI
jgi:hypothetical protein